MSSPAGAGPAGGSATSARFEARAMGSPLRLTVTGVDGPARDALWESARDEFEAAEAAMSRFRDASDLTRVNRAAGDGSWIPVDPRLRRALVAADRARRLTAGRFDPRVLADLERLGYRGAPVGEPAATGATEDSSERERVLAGPVVEVDRAGRVRVGRPVDLGGIGKGLALRWAGRILGRRLPAGGGALLEAGGDLVAIGSGPEPGEPWRVGLEDPAGGDELAVIDVPSGAVATSSVAVHRWSGPHGGPVHHLVDPGSGTAGGDGLVSVTVAGPDPAWAEVRTKQLFLAGPRGIGPLARSLDLAAWWVHADGELGMTPAARQRTAWARAR